jgi:hypothetical protein
MAINCSVSLDRKRSSPLLTRMDLELADQVEGLRNSACDEGEDLIDIPDGVDLVKRGGGGWVNGRSRNRRNCAYAGRSSAMSADESSPVITRRR